MYDAWNRLTRVEEEDQIVARCQYDALGRRTVKEEDIGRDGKSRRRRHYYYSSDWQVLEEWSFDSGDLAPELRLEHEYVWRLGGADDLVVRIDGHYFAFGARRWPLADDQGNVTALLKWDMDTPSGRAVADVVERYRYDAFGRPEFFSPDGSPHAESQYGWDVLYAGYRYDAESGLNHVRHRAYHPALGRWLQRDPAGNADSPNLYAYVAGNPVNAVDPLGLRTSFWSDPLEWAYGSGGFIWDVNADRSRPAPASSKCWDRSTSPGPAAGNCSGSRRPR